MIFHNAALGEKEDLKLWDVQECEVSSSCSKCVEMCKNDCYSGPLDSTDSFP